MDLNQNKFTDVEEGTRSVFAAVKIGATKKVKQFLISGGDVNLREEETKNTLLHFAVLNDAYNTAVVLLNYGADVSLTNEDELTPLQLAQKIPERFGFILAIQLSVRKRNERIKALEKERLIKESSSSRSNKTNTKLSNLHEITRLNLENARTMLKNLENETRRANKLVKTLEHQLSVIEVQLLVEAESDSIQDSNTSSSTINQDTVRCTVCWETPTPCVLQCVEGHILCDSCFSRPELQFCPECRVPLDQKIRNRALEALINKYTNPERS